MMALSGDDRYDDVLVAWYFTGKAEQLGFHRLRLRFPRLFGTKQSRLMQSSSMLRGWLLRMERHLLVSMYAFTDDTSQPDHNASHRKEHADESGKMLEVKSMGGFNFRFLPYFPTSSPPFRCFSGCDTTS